MKRENVGDAGRNVRSYGIFENVQIKGIDVREWIHERLDTINIRSGT
jgi:hypothetical protein